MATTATASNRQTDSLRVRRGEATALALDFLEKLHQLLETGMPVGEAIQSMQRRIVEPRLKEIANSTWRDLSEGLHLSDALRRFPSVFESTLVQTIEAGEATGNLVPILDNIIELLEERLEMRRKVLNSLAYPAFICTIALGVVLFFLFYLLPKIENMLNSMGGELTFSAKLIIGLSTGIIQYGPILLGLAVLAVVLFVQYRRSPEGRRVSDAWLLQSPVVGSVIAHIETARMTNLMATLLECGVHASEALKLVEKAMHNLVLHERFRQARKAINDGASFSQALSEHELLQDMDADILAVAENTGHAKRGFAGVYKACSKRLNQKLKALTVIFSTSAFLGAFGLVILIVFGIITSIMELSTNILG